MCTGYQNMQEVKHYQEIINKRLEDLHFPPGPETLYEPIRYLLALGGKRIRPALTLLAAGMFGCKPEQSLPTALAIELFHNFSLMHDDIMDKAPLRRGKPTVHEKWNTSAAILSGDFMLIESYKFIADNDAADLPEILALFNKTAGEVCIGQQLDMEYEKSDLVEIEDYLEMIRLKTAVLLGAALQLGAIVAKASEENGQLLYQFGENLGIAFQLQDDFLDVYGDASLFGKQIGGDILENKKTYMLLKALEMADREDKKELEHWIASTDYQREDKIAAIIRIYNKLDITSHLQHEMNRYTEKAFSALNLMEVSEESKAPLRSLAHSLLVRTQ